MQMASAPTRSGAGSPGKSKRSPSGASKAGVSAMNRKRSQQAMPQAAVPEPTPAPREASDDDEDLAGHGPTGFDGAPCQQVYLRARQRTFHCTYQTALCSPSPHRERSIYRDKRCEQLGDRDRGCGVQRRSQTTRSSVRCCKRCTCSRSRASPT